MGGFWSDLKDWLRRCWRRLRGWHWLIQIAVCVAALFLLVALCFKISDIWAFWDDDPDRGATIVAQDVFGDRVAKIVYLDQGEGGQNWKPKDSLWFDNVTQGSDLIPYDFFLVLKATDGSLFRSNENMNNRYRYLARKATYNNPDALPIGIVKDVYHGRAFMGFTCAACHTGQVNYNGTAMRIDGAPAMADMDTFLDDMSEALLAAQARGPVHDKFVSDVLALGNYSSAGDVEKDLDVYAVRLIAYTIINKSHTHYGFARLDAFGRIYNQVLEYVVTPGDVQAVVDGLIAQKRITADDLKSCGFTSVLEELKHKKVLNGEDRDKLMARLVVLGRKPGTLVTSISGLKKVLYFRDAMFNAPDAPVSYPFLWDIPQHDYLQWNGIAANAGLGPIGRNTGEVIGVFGTMNWSLSDHWTLAGVFSGQGLFNGHPIDYSSSVNVHNLALIEDKLKSLHSPLWPENILPRLDRARVARGEVVFDRYCQACHAEIDRTSSSRRVVAHMSALENIGTDKQMAVNGVAYAGYSGIVRNTYVDVGVGSLLLDKQAPVAALLTKTARGVVATPDADKWWPRRFAEWLYDVIFSLRSNDIQASVKSGDYNPDTTQAPFASVGAYKGRSLNGIWATAPYLHNGSVRNLYELLLPAGPRDGDAPGTKYRAGKFLVGSREFDPAQVGYRSALDGKETDPCSGQAYTTPVYDGFQFLTSQIGNANTGHEYGARDARDKDGNVILGKDGKPALPALTEQQRCDLLEYLKSL